MNGYISWFLFACTQSDVDGGFSTSGSLPNGELGEIGNEDVEQEDPSTTDSNTSCSDLGQQDTDSSGRDPSDPDDTDDCDAPMGIRKIVPDNSERAPINTHVFVSMIGNGNATHASITLLDPDNQSIEVSTESLCYYHESDTEYHCSYMIAPLESLESSTKYRVRVLGTEYHHNPGWSYESSFRTTSTEASLSSEAPSLDILRYEERPEVGLEPCDWQEVYKYELAVELAEPQDSQLSILQIYEVNGAEEELVHSLIVPEEHSEMEFRQVLNPGTEGNRCYRAVHMDVAGNQSESSPIVCWE